MISSPSNMTVLILAGGKSSRFGSNKALAIFQGKSLLQKAIDLAESISQSILIIGDSALQQYTGHQVVPDIIPGRGPAGGIYTGLSLSKSPLNVVVAVDLPMISLTIIEYLITFSGKGYEAIVPEENGQAQPLCAIYTLNYLDWMEKAVKTGKLKMKEIINRPLTYYPKIGENLPFYSSLLFNNVNTPAELSKLEQALEHGD